SNAKTVTKGARASPSRQKESSLMWATKGVTPRVVDAQVLVCLQQRPLKTGDHLKKGLRLRRLEPIVRDTQRLRPAHIPLLVRRREDDDAQGTRQRLLPNPLQNLEPVNPRQFQIQEHKAGHRMLVPIGKLTLAGQVVHGLLAITDDMKRIAQARPLPRAPHQEHVRLIVLDVEDSILAHYAYPYRVRVSGSLGTPRRACSHEPSPPARRTRATHPSAGAAGCTESENP